MRTYVQHVKWLQVVCLLLGISFLDSIFVQPNGGAFAELVDRIVAEVNEDIITQKELNELIENYQKRLQSQETSIEQQRKMMSRIRKEALNTLIDQTLERQQIEVHKLSVSEQTVNNVIEDVKKTNFLNDEQLVQQLAREGHTLDSYREHLKKQVLRSKLLNREIRSKVVLTENDVKTRYEAEQSKYGGEIKYHLHNILMSVPGDGNPEAKAEVARAMEDVLQKFEAGTPFDELARTYSQSSLASEGGNLGLFGLEDLSPQIRNAVKNLSAGQATPVLDTDMGLQIFYVAKIAKTPGVPYEDVRAKIEKELYDEILEKKFRLWLQGLRKKAHIRILK